MRLVGRKYIIISRTLVVGGTTQWARARAVFAVPVKRLYKSDFIMIITVLCIVNIIIIITIMRTATVKRRMIGRIVGALDVRRRLSSGRTPVTHPSLLPNELYDRVSYHLYVSRRVVQVCLPPPPPCRWSAIPVSEQPRLAETPVIYDTFDLNCGAVNKRSWRKERGTRNTRSARVA